jgi:hypothetical protein
MPFPLIPRGMRQGYERVRAFHCGNINYGRTKLAFLRNKIREQSGMV